MTDEEFNKFMQSAYDELSDKQDALELEYKISSAPRYLMDQVTERLEFLDADGQTVLTARFVDIGTYASVPGTWRWAWCNPFVLAPLRAKAQILRELAAETGAALFAWDTPFLIDDQEMAWGLAAASAKKLDAVGVYCAPNPGSNLYAFVAMTHIEKPKPPLEPVQGRHSS